MISSNPTKPSKEDTLPVLLSLICFFYYLIFLVKLGEMFYWGSDVVANTTYAVTMFGEVYRGGWTVPKPVHMLLFGSVYWITRDLWFVHLVPMAATSLTVLVGCKLILKHYRTSLGCIAFGFFMLTMPRMFITTMSGGSGCINTLFLLLAVVCLHRIDQTKCRLLGIMFLCLANLTRPESWASTYLVILLIIGLRFFSPNRLKLEKSDFLFLIPMGMPLIWIMVDWAGFADPLYSMKRSQSFAVDIATGKNPSQGLKLSDWTAYPAFLKNAFFDTFSLSSWLSARTAVLITLSLAGIVVMYLKHPRLFLLLACPVFGSTLFYFVASLGENLFRYGYLYYNWIFVTVVVSVGLAGICGLVRHLGQRRVAGLIRVTLACLVVLFLTAGPYEQAVVGRTIPTLKKWAAFSKRAGPAIQTIANDVDRTTGDPIIVTTTQVPGNRIALQMSTGKNIFLVERLLRKEQFGQNTLLPDFEGRTVYVAAPEYVPGAVGQFLQALVMNSKSREVIYDGTGIVVLKCLY